MGEGHKTKKHYFLCAFYSGTEHYLLYTAERRSTNVGHENRLERSVLSIEEKVHKMNVRGVITTENGNSICMVMKKK